MSVLDKYGVGVLLTHGTQSHRIPSNHGRQAPMPLLFVALFALSTNST
jgi:hypothetical protein